MIRTVVGISIAFLIAATASAQQIEDRPLEVSSSGTGSAAILSVYSARAGFDTLVSVYSGFARHAVRMRILDQSGNPQLSASIYLMEHGSSSFAITSSESGTPQVHFTDGACVLLADGPAQPDVLVPLDDDAGSIEFFAMGQVYGSDADNHVLAGDCGALQRFWDDGAWSENPAHGMEAPANTLKVSAMMINVNRATMYSVDATHLRNFSSVVQHMPPSSGLPDLSSAHAPSPDDETLTRSRNCFSNPCVVDDWDTPLDAVGAALTASRLYGEYVTSHSIGASTEWILNYPLRHYLGDMETLDVRVSILPRNLTDFPLVCIPETIPGFDDVWCTWTFNMSHDWTTSSVDIGFAIGHRPVSGQPPEYWPTAILSLDNKLHSASPIDDMPDTGIAVIHFYTSMQGYQDVVLINPYSTREYRGQPVIGLVLQEYSNGQLVDPDGNRLVARYGNVFDVGRVLYVRE